MLFNVSYTPFCAGNDYILDCACMEFLPCFKKKQKTSTFIHIIKDVKREDDEIEGEDMGVEDAILKKMKTINNLTKLNDTEYFTVCQ